MVSDRRLQWVATNTQPSRHLAIDREPGGEDHMLVQKDPTRTGRGTFCDEKLHGEAWKLVGHGRNRNDTSVSHRIERSTGV